MYTDMYDILPMDVGHIILGRLWLFDLDVTIYGRTNHYSFVHNGKKVKLIPNQPKPLTPEKKVDKGKGKVDALAHEKKSDKGKHKMVMNLISHDQIESSLNEDSTCYAPVAREAEPKTGTLNRSHPKDQPSKLPPM